MGSNQSRATVTLGDEKLICAAGFNEPRQEGRERLLHAPVRERRVALKFMNPNIPSNDGVRVDVDEVRSGADSIGGNVSIPGENGLRDFFRRSQANKITGVYSTEVSIR